MAGLNPLPVDGVDFDDLDETMPPPELEEEEVLLPTIPITVQFWASLGAAYQATCRCCPVPALWMRTSLAPLAFAQAAAAAMSLAEPT